LIFIKKIKAAIVPDIYTQMCFSWYNYLYIDGWYRASQFL